MTNSQKKSSSAALIIVLGIVAALALVFALQRPADKPSTRLGKAMEEMAEGVEDAARELKPERTTGEKIGDAVEDMGESIQDASEE